MDESRIASVMQRDFLRLRPDEPIRAAVAQLVRTQSGAAAVVNHSGGLAGILTQKDCFRSALGASYYRQWQGTVADHATPDVETLDIETDLVTAAEAFIEKPFRVYPVTDGGRLVGMLTRTDLLAAFLQYG
ncbi:CBS domain-containing protein [Psychromarinibacter sp. C21-152]|uniref:CBS domain-containing protein n=1 Tax=Psychromarinibacter sediminicola TaxID=3033385 RepID=A0AAE3NWD6_9RHOB|nr:CBS domain-containing protein [Psychromarinibacter sediminicola]MDF0601862.1 CBS domain-containing protein [Psychromarinibacter sediminicola]